MRRFLLKISVFFMLALVSGVGLAQGDEITYFVSTTGSDSNDGLTEATAFRTVTQAWNMIPMGEVIPQPVVIVVLPGTYTAEDLPSYWESRYGTKTAPITIKGDGESAEFATIFPSINMYDSRYVEFTFLKIVSEDGMPFHCEKCDHVSLIFNEIIGADPGGGVRETVKFNQSQYITLSGNDISGADDNAVDFVAVQYAIVTDNEIHNAGDWCMYAKGGSAYISVARNRIHHCGTGGFTAGQGTGFQFMTPPWLQYEAYAIAFDGNVVYDTYGAGVGINGGYDVIVTGNLFYNVGERSHLVEVVYGLRTCDGQPGDEGRERCAEYHDLGGWGNDLIDDGTNAVLIPNKNIYIYNNTIYNLAPYQSGDQHFTIASPYEGDLQANSNLGRVVADENLQIRGNIIWNGDASMLLGVEPDFGAGCAAGNPTCNAAQLLADNAINTLEPLFEDPASLNFRLANMDEVVAYFDAHEIPVLPAWDVSVPLPDPEWFAYPIGQ